MAERKQAKRERRQAAGNAPKGGRRQAEQSGEEAKTTRRETRGAGKPRARASGRGQAAGRGEAAGRAQAAGRGQASGGRGQAATRGQGGSNGEAIESRLARIEEAVTAQSQLSEELLAKLDEVLEEARRPAG